MRNTDPGPDPATQLFQINHTSWNYKTVISSALWSTSCQNVRLMFEGFQIRRERERRGDYMLSSFKKSQNSL